MKPRSLLQRSCSQPRLRTSAVSRAASLPHTLQSQGQAALGRTEHLSARTPITPWPPHENGQSRDEDGEGSAPKPLSN